MLVVGFLVVGPQVQPLRDERLADGVKDVPAARSAGRLQAGADHMRPVQQGPAGDKQRVMPRSGRGNQESEARQAVGYLFGAVRRANPHHSNRAVVAMRGGQARFAAGGRDSGKEGDETGLGCVEILRLIDLAVDFSTNYLVGQREERIGVQMGATDDGSGGIHSFLR